MVYMYMSDSFCHWDLFNMYIYIYNIDLQAVANKMVREISLEVGVKLFFSNFW